jgi:hypothetical protein
MTDITITARDVSFRAWGYWGLDEILMQNARTTI